MASVLAIDLKTRNSFCMMSPCSLQRYRLCDLPELLLKRVALMTGEDIGIISTLVSRRYPVIASWGLSTYGWQSMEVFSPNRCIFHSFVPVYFTGILVCFVGSNVRYWLIA